LCSRGVGRARRDGDTAGELGEHPSHSFVHDGRLCGALLGEVADVGRGEGRAGLDYTRRVSVVGAALGNSRSEHSGVPAVHEVPVEAKA